MIKPRHGPWFNVRRCVHCREALSNPQRRYSDGRCPLCGHKEQGAGTTVETTEHAAHMVWPTWWKFWDSHIEEHL